MKAGSKHLHSTLFFSHSNVAVGGRAALNECTSTHVGNICEGENTIGDGVRRIALSVQKIGPDTPCMHGF